MGFVLALLITFCSLLPVSGHFTDIPLSSSSSNYQFDTSLAQSDTATQDTLRALLLFVQFKDYKVKGSPDLNYRDWPLFDNPGRLPDFANAILSPSPHAPYPDSSLTAYFHEQSLGQYVLYGEAYDSVLVSTHPEEHYHRPKGGYGLLTKEMLDKLDAYGFDFSKYDHNQDGLVDHIFVVLRGDTKRDSKRFGWTGASCLDGRCSGTLAGGGPRYLPLYDGKKVDWDLSGSYIIHRTPGNIIPFIYHVRLMAHELGHDIWDDFFVHVPAYQRNDVPRSHNRGGRRDCISYMLMAGAGGALDCHGSQTISAFERDLLGWINCKPLTDTQIGLSLGDLYTTSDCYTLALDVSSTNRAHMGRRLHISNLQRKGYFDQIRKGGVAGQYDMGLLRTTGMLVTHSHRYATDVIPADNNLQLKLSNADYHGDLFGPETATQLTPWTQPNINGFNKYPGNISPKWAAIDNIRYAPNDSTLILFDFYEDFRQSPIIRQDSWMGHGLAGYTFTSPLQILNKSTLTIDKEVTFAKSLHISRHSKVVITESGVLHLPASANLKMGAGARIEVAGKLVLDAVIQRSIDVSIEKVGEGKVVASGQLVE